VSENISVVPKYNDSKDALVLYNKALDNIDALSVSINNAHIDLEKAINLNIERTASDLDMYDYLFAVIFGILGAALSTNKSIENFCHDIHEDAGEKSPKTVLGKILNHYNEPLDQVEGSFINRNGQKAEVGFHRLLRGHDPLSFGKDNPFYLLVKGNGLLIGVAKVFRHLIADTFSKQGLPIPGHSFFDQVKDDGKTTNALREISMNLANNYPVDGQKYFRHIFTIRAQDIAGQGFVWSTAKAYLYARGITDLTRMRQYKIISYGINFFAHAGIGAIRQGGVPYISWPALAALIKEIAGLFIDSYKEIKILETITDDIRKGNDEIEAQVFATGLDLKTYDNAREYIKELEDQDRIFEDLVAFFEEG